MDEEQPEETECTCGTVATVIATAASAPMNNSRFTKKSTKKNLLTN